MPSIERLVGRPVAFTVSDPWDFGTTIGTGPFPSRVLQTLELVREGAFGRREQDTALIRVDTPFVYNDLKCEFFLVSPRHVGVRLSDIDRHREVAANFVRLPGEHALSEDPFAPISRIEGSVVLVGSIQAQSQ